MPDNFPTSNERDIVLDALGELPKKQQTIKPELKKKVNTKTPVKSVLPSLKPKKEVVHLPATAKPSVPKKRKDHFWLKTIPFFIVIIILALFVVISWGLSPNSSLKTIAQPLATLLHYPVAFVNSAMITYPDLSKDEKIVIAYYSTQSAQASVQKPDEATIRSLALSKLIRDTLLQKEYDRVQVTATQDDISLAFAILFGAPPSDVNVQQAISAVYGITVDQFIESYLKGEILRQKYSQTLTSNSQALQQRKIQAQEMYDQVKSSPEKILSIGDQLASRYSYVQAADIGYVAPKDLRKEFSEIASLKQGKLSSLLESAEGYHVLYVAEILTPEKDDSKVFHLQQLFVAKPNIDLWLSDQLSAAKITVFIPKYRWNMQCEQVVTKASCTGTNVQALSGVTTADSKISIDLLNERSPYNQVIP